MVPSRFRRGPGGCSKHDPDDAQKEQAMLVLSRKLGQRFQIGHDVRVTIVKIDRNSVRIGIEAPDDVTVFREEIAPAEAEPAQPPRSVVA
jgi:carbon storage regulator